jgi:glycosyltransferase involved in cell wall biosynthesis
LYWAAARPGNIWHGRWFGCRFDVGRKPHCPSHFYRGAHRNRSGPVAWRSVGITEAIRDGETGLLFPFDNAPVLAHTLGRLLADVPLMERLRTAGPGSVRDQFTAVRMAGETVQVYRQTLADWRSG